MVGECAVAGSNLQDSNGFVAPSFCLLRDETSQRFDDPIPQLRMSQMRGTGVVVIARRMADILKRVNLIRDLSTSSREY